MSDEKNKAYPIEILLLSKQNVDALISHDLVFEAVEATFRADGEDKLVIPKKDPIMLQEDGRTMLMAMPGYLKPMNLAGFKWMRNYPQKPNDIPQLWGQLLVMSKADTGLPYCIMDGTTITAMRTAGGHAVIAAKYLAKKDSRCLSVLGSGAQALAGIRAFDYFFSLECIKLYSPHAMQKQTQIHNALGNLRGELRFCNDPKDLCEDADILLTASSGNKHVIKPSWIPDGCLIASMTSFQDIPCETSRLVDKWVLGHYASDVSQILMHPRFQQELSQSNVYGTLGKIICGELPGRERINEKILFTHMGMGALDLAVGDLIYKRAKKENYGQSWRLI